MKSFHFKPACALGVALLLSGCLNSTSGEGGIDGDGEISGDSLSVSTTTPFSAMFATGSWPNVGYYIVPIPSLTEGVVTLEGNGVEMSAELYAQDVPQKNGFYYHAKEGGGTLGKFYVQDGQLKTAKKVPFATHGISAYVWKDDETLIVAGVTSSNEVRYSVINVRNLVIVKTGAVTAEAITDTVFNRYIVGAVEYRDDKVFVSYSLGANWALRPNMPVYGKGHIAVMDYATMAVEKTLEDSTLYATSGPSVYAQTSFKTENGDIYLVTDPGYNSDTVNASHIHRIAAGSTNLDTAYKFNLSASINGGMGAAMWYLGSGKAIVRYREVVKNVDASHYYAVVNVQTGTFVRKLTELPLDIGERMIQAVIMVDGKAYIVVTTSGDDYIWEYNPATDVVTRGAQLVGADIVKRLEKLD